MPSRIRRVAVVMTAISSLCAVACATILGFDDPSLEGRDAGDDPNSLDAANDADPVDAGPCDPDAAFKLRDVPGITRLGWPVMRSATLSPDERTIYFHGTPDDGGLEQIYVAERTGGPTGPFDAPKLLKNVNGPPGANVSPSISVDGRTLVFARSTVDASDLFIARRSDENKDFPGAGPLTSVNTPRLDQNPFLRPNVEEELWFSSTRLEDAGRRIFRARAREGTFGDAEVIPVSGVKTTRQETPVISADGKILFYSADGIDVPGDINDVWEARAETAGGPFTTRGRVVELSAPGAQDYPSWLSPDGCRLYVHTAVGKQGTIYVGVRER